MEEHEYKTTEPIFEPGRAYLVKALDHFTRHEDNDEQLYLELLGIYKEDNKDYHKFISIYYRDYTSEEQFYTPEVRFIVRGTVREVQPLNLEVMPDIEIKNDKIFEKIVG